jgi:hypothetical protein
VPGKQKKKFPFLAPQSCPERLRNGRQSNRPAASEAERTKLKTSDSEPTKHQPKPKCADKMGSNEEMSSNGLENFWSLVKRGLKGTYISVEPFDLFRYLDEQVFRSNNRARKSTSF